MEVAVDVTGSQDPVASPPRRNAQASIRAACFPNLRSDLWGAPDSPPEVRQMLEFAVAAEVANAMTAVKKAAFMAVWRVCKNRPPKRLTRDAWTANGVRHKPHHVIISHTRSRAPPGVRKGGNGAG